MQGASGNELPAQGCNMPLRRPLLSAETYLHLQAGIDCWLLMS